MLDLRFQRCSLWHCCRQQQHRTRPRAIGLHLEPQNTGTCRGLASAWRQQRTASGTSLRICCTAESSTQAKSAKAAVEEGLSKFASSDAKAALKLFEQAMQLQPNGDEARAALYNAACCLVKLKDWQSATDCIVKAVNEHELRLGVALEDPDLAPLRETRVWLDSLDIMKGGLTASSLVGLRSETRSPFRFIRLLATGGTTVAALIALVVTLPRFIASVSGDNDAPDLNAVLVDLAINAGGVALFSFLFSQDIKGDQSDKQAIEREEKLGRLQVKIGKDRIVPLATLRGVSRPMVISGSKAQIQRTLKAAAPVEQALLDRGVRVIPLPIGGNEADPLAALKSEFSGKVARGFANNGGAAPPASTSGSSPAASPSKLQIEAADAEEWRAWLVELKRGANVKGDHVFVQVQLDGSVRSSGIGSPNWQGLVQDLPTIDSFRTKITDGLRQ